MSRMRRVETPRQQHFQLLTVQFVGTVSKQGRRLLVHQDDAPQSIDYDRCVRGEVQMRSPLGHRDGGKGRCCCPFVLQRRLRHRLLFQVGGAVVLLSAHQKTSLSWVIHTQVKILWSEPGSG